MLFLLYVSSKCLLSVYSMPGIVLSAGDEPTNMGDWSCTRAANRFASRHLQGGEVSASSYCSWDSQGKNTEVVCHPLLYWTTFCQTSPPWSVHLGWPHMAWLSFIDLCQENALVIANTLFQQHKTRLYTWTSPKSDWLYSLQPKMEKLYTVSKNKTGNWLWLRSWTPYCQIQTEIEESRENH